TTSTAIEGASPATASPAANSTSPARYGRAGPTRSASRPAATVPSRLASMKPLNTHPYRLRSPRSRSTWGMIVNTASASAAMNVIMSTRPVVMLRRSGDHRPAGSEDARGGDPLAQRGLVGDQLDVVAGGGERTLQARAEEEVVDQRQDARHRYCARRRRNSSRADCGRPHIWVTSTLPLRVWRTTSSPS